MAIPGDHAAALSDEIDTLRKAQGYHPLDPLKFTAHGRPTHISAQQHLEAKQQLMEAAARHDVKLIVSMILHSIATSPEEARLNEINRVCFHFDCHLRLVSDCGIVLVDNFQCPGLISFFREKFGLGLKGLPYSDTYRLKQIIGVHLSHIGFSHFCSLIDIALGNLRFAINERGNPAKAQVVAILLAQWNPLSL